MHFLGALLSPVLHNDGDIFKRKTTKWGTKSKKKNIHTMQKTNVLSSQQLYAAARPLKVIYLMDGIQ